MGDFGMQTVVSLICELLKAQKCFSLVKTVEQGEFLLQQLEHSAIELPRDAFNDVFLGLDEQELYCFDFFCDIELIILRVRNENRNQTTSIGEVHGLLLRSREVSLSDEHLDLILHPVQLTDHMCECSRVRLLRSFRDVGQFWQNLHGLKNSDEG